MKKKLGRWFTFSPLVVGALWLIISVIFWLMQITTETSMLLVTIKDFANRWLGMLALLSFPLMIIGIVFLSTAKSKNAHLFTIKSIIQYSRKASKKHMSKFLLGFGIYIVVQIISIAFGYSQEAGNIQRQNMFVTFVVMLMTLWIGLGYQNLALKIIHNVKTKSEDIFVSFKKSINYLGAYAIMYVLVLIGLILFIIPGVIVALRLSMIPYLILDKNMGIIASIKTSRKMTRGFAGDIFLLNLLGGLINVLGMLVLFVGLLWTLPLLIIANAYLYKKIVENRKY